jgi:hypothetical protein
MCGGYPLFFLCKRLIAGARKKNVCFSVIERIIYFNKMDVVNVNEAYILM